MGLRTILGIDRAFSAKFVLIAHRLFRINDLFRRIGRYSLIGGVALFPRGNRNGEAVLLGREGADRAGRISAGEILGSIEVENYGSRAADALAWHIGVENTAFDLGAAFAGSVAKEEEESALAGRDGKETDCLSVENELGHPGRGLIGDQAQSIGDGKAAHES